MQPQTDNGSSAQNERERARNHAANRMLPECAAIASRTRQEPAAAAMQHIVIAAYILGAGTQRTEESRRQAGAAAYWKRRKQRNGSRSRSAAIYQSFLGTKRDTAATRTRARFFIVAEIADLCIYYS